ncbi:hypothetical protein ACIQU4_38150 [Streptomyces sp. NPDC090741]|uniref:hypothetical protein n=1 Tax=Streptomyces sp. NPDC090741 TaxID=3365967 RepID=UPI0037FDBB61
MTEPDRQDNAAYDGGTQNITHGGDVIHHHYPRPAESTPAPTPAPTRGLRALSGRTLALAAAGAAAVIAVPTTILALQHDPLKTANADSAHSAPAAATPSPAASPSGSTSAAPSNPPATPLPQAAGIAAPPAPAPTPSAGSTRRTATPSSPYPSDNVACRNEWTSSYVTNIDFQPCTQAVSGTGAVQFGVKVRNAGTTQLVVAVLVKPYVAEVGAGECPMHPGPWQEVVIDAGKTWYSQFSQCSLSAGIKGHRVQSSAKVALDPASDADFGNAKLDYSRAFDIEPDGRALVAK